MKDNIGCWFEIYVNDMARAKEFYEKVFDKELMRIDNPDEAKDFPQPEMWAFPWVEDAPGAAGAICKMDGVEAGGNSTLIYFSCEDCAHESSRVNEAGGKLIAPKMSIGENGFIAVAMDSEGNNIGFHSMT